MPDPIAAATRTGLKRLVHGGLRGVWLRGDLPAGAFVWAANHHSWWDPFVAGAMLWRLDRKVCLLMRQDNLLRYGFARRLGVFGTDEPRAGLRHLSEGRALVVYPEGELRPAGPLAPLADGASWFATRARVPLVAVAVRVALRGHQAPEAYVSATSVEPADTDRLAHSLRADLAALDEQISTADPRRPLDGFRRILTGRRSWDERIDTLTRRLPWMS